MMKKRKKRNDDIHRVVDTSQKRKLYNGDDVDATMNGTKESA